MLYNNINKQAATQKVMDKYCRYSVEQKKLYTKKYIMYDSIHIKFKNWQKLIYDASS